MQTMLERIAEAEKRADLVLEEANQKARERIAEAKAASETAIANASEKERAKTANALMEAEKQGIEQGEQILSSVRSEIEAVRQSALDRLPEAVAYLLERIDATV